LKDLDEKWLDGKLMGIFSSSKNQIRQSLSHLIRFKEILGFLIPFLRQKSFLRKPYAAGSPTGIPDQEKMFENQRECLKLGGNG